jgi:hypothetical protein
MGSSMYFLLFLPSVYFLYHHLSCVCLPVCILLLHLTHIHILLCACVCVYPLNVMPPRSLDSSMVGTWVPSDTVFILSLARQLLLYWYVHLYIVLQTIALFPNVLSHLYHFLSLTSSLCILLSSWWYLTGQCSTRILFHGVNLIFHFPLRKVLQKSSH